MPQVSDYTALLSGSTLTGRIGTATFVSFSFPTVLPDYLLHLSEAARSSFRSLAEAAQANARKALALIADVCGITFLEVAPGEGDLNIMVFDLAKLGYSNAAGLAYYPGNEWGGGDGVSSDIFMHPSYEANMHVLLHEIGHAVGLKHSFDGAITLLPEFDNYRYTMMSYSSGGVSGDTLGSLDDDALRHLYGAETADGTQVTSWNWNASTRTLSQSGSAANESIFGIGGSDFIQGGAGADRIYGRAGNDVLDGGEGNDLIYGGSGNDRIDGGSGIDQIFGDLGDDTLFGNLDNDQIYGGLGNDVIDGGDGDDFLRGDLGNDQLRGGFGVDQLYGDAGDDILMGDGGNDNLFGGLGNDTLDGGDGDDFLRGEDGNDQLRGGLGADQLYGDAGDDILFGDAGIDNLSGGLGNDTLNGGNDNDRLLGNDGLDVLTGGAGNDFVDGGNGLDTAVFSGLFRSYTVNVKGGAGTVTGSSEGTDTLTSVEFLQFKDGRFEFDANGVAAQVTRLYDTVLKRAPDQAGLDLWVDQLESGSGATIKTVATGFLNSPEFQAKTGSLSNAQYVEFLYVNALGRASDAAGKALWVGELDSGRQDRADLLVGFSESVEHRGQTADLVAKGFFNTDDAYQAVSLLYDSFAGRLPDAAGLISWAEAIKSGSMTIAQVANGFANSAEFQKLIAGMSHAQLVDFMYLNTLDRGADAAGKAAWVQALDAGLSDGDLLMAFSQSQEHFYMQGSHITNGINYLKTLGAAAADEAVWAEALDAGPSDGDLILMDFPQSSEHFYVQESHTPNGVDYF